MISPSLAFLDVLFRYFIQHFPGSHSLLNCGTRFQNHHFRKEEFEKQLLSPSLQFDLSQRVEDYDVKHWETMKLKRDVKGNGFVFPVLS
jgi:hypothetical protein